MRKYTYIWHDKKNHRIIASGIETKDLMSYFQKERRYLILLSHNYESIRVMRENKGSFDYKHDSDIKNFSKQNIYNWGDICYIDCINSPAAIQKKKTKAEILYFNHCGIPYTMNKTYYSEIDNHFMIYGHDDGWYLSIYYNKWENMKNLLNTLKLNSNLKKLVLDDTEYSYFCIKNVITTIKVRVM